MPSLLLLLVLMANLLMLLAPQVNSSLLPKKCGKCLTYNPANGVSGHRVKRITDGMDGDIRQMPWMVYLTINYTMDGHTTFDTLCTGSLVSRRHVLTAGHCAPLARMPNSSYMITAHFGSANRSAMPVAISVTTASFHKHPQASSYLVNNSDSDFPNRKLFINAHDTALIDLGQDLEFDETVQPICVACLDNQTFPQGEAYIAGWGSINPICIGLPGAFQDLFSYQGVQLQHCLTPGYVDADKVCTQADSTHGIRGGDSGGALLASANNGESFLQVAVVGDTNCRSTAREDGASKIDKDWFEQMTSVKCQKLSVDNDDCEDCEDEEEEW